MATTLHETDPTVYLTNGSRIALGLEGISDAPQSVVQAAQDAYYKASGVWPYVDGMPNGSTPAPPKTNIGTVSATGDDLTGTNLAIAVGAESTVTAAFDGDAKDVAFKWVIRSGAAVSIKSGANSAAVTLVGDSAGAASIRCTFTSNTASDSPQEVTITAAVS